jgi:hypothetical protein
MSPEITQPARVAKTLEVVVLLLLVAAHVAAWWVVPKLGLDLRWSILSFVAMFVCQPVLVAAWMIVGPGAWWWRWPLCGLSLMGELITDPGPDPWIDSTDSGDTSLP